MTNELPPGWTRTALGTLCKVEYGKGLSKRQRVETGPVGVYGSAGLVGHHDRVLVDEPVVIVGRKGNAGAVYHTEDPSWPIDTTYFLRIPNGICSKYLGVQLRHLDLVRQDSSTTIPSLRRPDLEAVSIALAPSAEQARIVDAIEEHLSRLDAVEATLVQAGERLDAFRSSVFAAAFRAHSDLPQDWAWRTIGNIAEVQLGRQRSPEHHSGEQMRPYLRSANVTWSGISLHDVKEMNFGDADFERYRLEPGDLLLNEASGSPSEVGKPAIWGGEIDGCCFQNTLLRLRPREVELDYLYWYCYSSASSGRFGEAGRGVNIRHLGKQGLAQFPVPVPPRHEQALIAEQIRSALEHADSLQLSIREATARIAALRRSVLSEAFDGRLVPQDPQDEPASVLLERIAAARRSEPKRQKISA